MSLLQANDLRIAFGGINAVDGASLSVAKGELLGLIGPNGAGKTTFINLLTGVLRPQQGRIRLRGEDITDLPTDQRVRAGLVRTHQIVRPFARLSVIENVALAAGKRRTASALRSMFEFRREHELKIALAILDWLGLADVRDRNPTELPLGQLKRLEVARALALDPEVIFLDEPLAGLNQREASALAATIVELNKGGLTVVLVEHNLAEILRISSRLAVLNRGSILAEGPSDVVINLPEVRDAYIGEARVTNA
jgi:branched-chain amino acid transport system ATP-binding protein